MNGNRVIPVPKVMALEMKRLKVERVGAVRQWLRHLLRNQRGTLLLETVVALTVFGILGTAVLSSVQTSYISKRQFDIQSESENIVRNQMEYVFEQPYKPWVDTYLTITPPTAYSVLADALQYGTSTDPNVETVRITVNHYGQAVKVFETIRTNR